MDDKLLKRYESLIRQNERLRNELLALKREPTQTSTQPVNDPIISEAKLKAALEAHAVLLTAALTSYAEFSGEVIDYCNSILKGLKSEKRVEPHANSILLAVRLIATSAEQRIALVEGIRHELVKVLNGLKGENDGEHEQEPPEETTQEETPGTDDEELRGAGTESCDAEDSSGVETEDSEEGDG